MELPSAQSPKSFWQRPEGKTGMFFLLVIAAGLVFAGVHLLPFILLALQNTIMMLVMGVALFGLIFVLMDPKFRAMIGGLYQIAMRGLTSTVIELDPIAIAEGYLEKLQGSIDKMSEQLDLLRGQADDLFKKIKKNEDTIQKSMGIASNAKIKMSKMDTSTAEYAEMRGVVAQNYPLFEHRTVMSNMMLAASKKEKDSKVAKDKVLEMLNEFELVDKRNLYPMQLSGGQRQRLSIIQQVLCSEHFLLMDEPFSGLDLLMLEKTQQLLTKIANMHELNTIILITHDITAAAAISDHIWMMGRERDAEGNKIPGSKIMKEYCLVEEDLCWDPTIITQKRFTDFVAKVKEDFRYM